MTEPAPNLFQEGLAAADRGDFARAESIAQSMLEANRQDVHALQILGFLNFRRGRTKEAMEAFVAASHAAPGQPEILYWIGLIALERGFTDDAVRALSEAVRIRPQYADAQAQLGEACFQLRRADEALSRFETAISLAPNSPQILAKAARHFERIHDLARARQLAERAIAIEPQHEIAHILLAEVDLREGKADSVIDRLSPFGVDAGRSRNAAKIHRLLANALDRKGEWDKAFAHFTRSNEFQHALYSDGIKTQRSPLTAESLTLIIDFFAQEDCSTWTRHADLEGDAPVFLLGFVRSGTTWLDQILSSHPRLVVLEEEDTFSDAWDQLLMSQSDLERLRTLSAEQVNHYRRAYWRRVSSALKGDLAGRILVDKAPLRTAQMSLIHRLFPESKIIFAMRDPRDTVLSAFQQHFWVSASTHRFLQLRSAAEFYDQVMTLSEIHRAQMPLDVMEVRYEHVVHNFEATLRPLIDFLGIDWTDAMFDYDKTARSRPVLTASAAQVVQKPYATSIGKWRQYQPNLAEVLPILDKWAERFGYKPSVSR